MSFVMFLPKILNLNGIIRKQSDVFKLKAILQNNQPGHLKNANSIFFFKKQQKGLFQIKEDLKR